MGFLEKLLNEMLSLYIPFPVPLEGLYLLPGAPLADSHLPEAGSACDLVMALWV